METKTPSLDRLITSYLMCCQTEGKSPKTIEWYGSNLKRLCSFLRCRSYSLRVEEINMAEIREFIYHLQNEAVRWANSRYIKDGSNLSPYSVQGYVRSIKAFWSWLTLEGYASQNVMHRLRLPKVPKKVVATFAPEQIDKLLRTLDAKTASGFRDRVIMLILLDTGIRLSELVGLRLEDVDSEQSCFLVRGKGDKERIVPFGAQVRRALWRYLSHFRGNFDELKVHELFISETGIPLKPRAVQSMLRRLGERAGISGVRCSPHTFRHTFAKQYLMCGGDVFSLQRILGHSSLEVVKMYVNLASSDISIQHRKFSPVDNLYLVRGRQSSRILPVYPVFNRESRTVNRNDRNFRKFTKLISK